MGGAPAPSYHPVEFLSGLNIEESAILDNIRVNAARDFPAVSIRKALVTGGGPSLARHIEDIREKQRRGFHIYALNNTARFLRQHGIVPNCQFIIDARPENIAFVERYDDTTYFLGAQCDPALFDKLAGCRVHIVYNAAADGATDLIADIRPGATVLGSAPTSGLQVLNLLDVLGYRVMHLYGYDSSYEGDSHHAYAQPLNDGQAVHEFQFQGRTYLSSGPMGSQAQQFCQVFRKYTARGAVLEVFGDGLLPDMWRYHEAVQAHAPQDVQERVKYETIWGTKQYREFSPGEGLVDAAIQALGLDRGATVIDFGCGTGRAARALQGKGMSVKGVDFASNCLDPEIDIPFVQANLWALPKMQADAGFCTDVMEHIPTEKVGLVLDKIRSCVPKCFFAISFVPDAFGETIGRPLHLTVRPKEWWLRELQDHWAHVEPLEGGSFVCRAKEN